MKSKAMDEILKHLSDIEKWSAAGETESAIASRFGITRSTLWNYKQKEKRIEDAIKAGRRKFVGDLRSTLVKKATGFIYEERKVLQENGKIIREEIIQKQALPDVGAIHLLLKNYDSEEWADSPRILELKREELELKKSQQW